jgi:hypothetical protein
MLQMICAIPFARGSFSSSNLVARVNPDQKSQAARAHGTIAGMSDVSRILEAIHPGDCPIAPATWSSAGSPLSSRLHKPRVQGSLDFGLGGRLVVPGDDNTVNTWDLTTTDNRRRLPS